ncbi:uncharacterized protein LOC144656789 isoform X2 [Oculina patagonica]
MADSARPSGSNELDHPEVLSRERLLEILYERSMRQEDLVNLEKSDLVQLFYNYVTPLPQRLHQLRRAKRETPCGRSGERVSSKGRTSTIIRLTKRKSDEIVTTTPIKITRTEHSNSIKINRGTPCLDSLNKGINSVSINATSPTTVDTRTSHEGSTVNKLIKPKVVKLNRKTLGLHVDKSVEHSPLKDESSSSLNGGPQKEVAVSSSSESGSDVNESEIRNTKRKFEKVAVTWP